MPKKRQGERGEQRFASLTYSQIARWTGLKLSTVQSYGANRRFDPNDIESVLRWVNARRQARGLPLIGIPQKISEESRPENSEEGGDEQKPPENRAEADSDDSQNPKCPPIAGPSYNPITGEFDGEA